MKKWVRKIVDHCVMVVCSPVTWILLALYCLTLFFTMKDAAKGLVLWKYMVTLPEPEACALCADRGTAWDALCLVKLETGEVTPITAGQSATLPKESVYIRPNLFCHDCRAKIGEAIEETELFTEGYVLADLHHLKDIRIYPLVAGEEYDIRGCTVEITRNKRSEGPTVAVTGHD